MTDGKKPARYACHRNGVMVESESGEYVEYADLIAAQEEMAKVCAVLRMRCDRDWKDETPLQIACIAANAIYWRDEALALRGEPVMWAVTHNGEFTLNVFTHEGNAVSAKRTLDIRHPKDKREIVPLYAAPISGERDE